MVCNSSSMEVPVHCHEGIKSIKLFSVVRSTFFDAAFLRTTLFCNFLLRCIDGRITVVAIVAIETIP
jgi:hypothetical protein